MELVVSAGLFMILMVISFGIFTFGLRGQQRALIQTRVDRESQLIMEALAKKIRSSQVDYDFYTDSIVNPVDILALRDASNISYVFSLGTNPPSFELSIDQSPAISISSSLVNVTDVDFFIEPIINPFVPGQAPVTQPRVTVVFDISASKGAFQTSSKVEQTIPQRGGAY